MARRIAGECFAVDFIKEIRSKDHGIGGLKLWYMYQRKFTGKSTRQGQVPGGVPQERVKVAEQSVQTQDNGLHTRSCDLCEPDQGVYSHRPQSIMGK